MSSLLRPSSGKEKRDLFKKPTTGIDEARRKREDEMMRIRAKAKLEAIQKKRNMGGVDQSWSSDLGNEPLMDSTEQSSKVRARLLALTDWGVPGLR